MAKNYMADVARMLGVELEEEFNIVASNVYIDCMLVRYMLNTKGLFYYSEARKSWQSAADFILLELLTGKKTIRQLPWKPKQNGFYYCVRWYMEQNGKWRIEAKEERYSRLCANDNMRVDVCNCFKTREDAEEQKYEIFKRLTGKDWHETYGKEGGDGNV